MARALLFGGTDTLGAPRVGTAKPKSFDVQVQDIASAAHSRGVNVMKGEVIVGTVEAAELCRTIRAARECARGDQRKFDHVGALTTGIANKLGQRGAVMVTQVALNLLRGYARPGNKARDTERKP